jgi:serine/threonine protein kinase
MNKFTKELANKSSCEIIYNTSDIRITKHTKNDKNFIIKDYLKDEKLLKELADNEININESLKKLRHKNITRYYGHRTFCNSLVFEYSSIGSLYDYKLKHRYIESGVLKDIVTGVVNGIRALHSMGIIHNDIKMSNVLLFRDKKGRLYPKLCDFNISHEVKVRAYTPIAETQDDEFNFTLEPVPMKPTYFFPIARPNLDRRILPTFPSDYFALGLMLYELFIGEKPFGIFEDVIESVEKKCYARTDAYMRCDNAVIKDLIERLIVEESDRLNDENILEHQFFMCN